MSEKNSQNRANERLKESLSAALDGQANDFEFHRVLGEIQKDDELRSLAGRYQQMGDGVRGKMNRFANVDISGAVMSAIEKEDAASSVSGFNENADAVVEAGSSSAVASLKNGWVYLGKVAMAASVAAAVVISARMMNPAEVNQPIALSTEQAVISARMMNPAKVNQPIALSTEQAVISARMMNPAEVNQPIALSTEQAVISQPLQLAQVGNTSYGAAGIRAGYNSRQHASVTPGQLAYAQSIANRATRERFHAYALQHAEYSAVGLGQSLLPFARLTSFDTQ